LAVPEEKVELIRGIYDAFNRGDFDAAIASADPQIELVRPGDLSPLIGAKALRAWMEPDAFESQAVHPLEFTVAGSKVLVRQRLLARGAGSGIEMDIESWTVWTLGDEGRVTRMEVFLDHHGNEALKAAGLSE
jgi:ketosteroid isomerase-like protein